VEIAIFWPPQVDGGAHPFLLFRVLPARPYESFWPQC
jgi:hypothetical protein